MKSEFEEIISSCSWTCRLLMKVLSAEKISGSEKHEVNSEEFYNLHDSSTIVKLRGRTEWKMYHA